MNIGQRVVVVNESASRFNKPGTIVGAKMFDDGVVMYGIVFDGSPPDDVLAFLSWEVAAI